MRVRVRLGLGLGLRLGLGLGLVSGSGSELGWKEGVEGERRKVHVCGPVLFRMEKSVRVLACNQRASC